MKIIINICFIFLAFHAVTARTSQRESRNLNNQRPWMDGFIADSQTVEKRKLCNQQCGSGKNYFGNSTALECFSPFGKNIVMGGQDYNFLKNSCFMQIADFGEPPSIFMKIEGSWRMNLIPERLSFIYNKPSLSLAIIDSFRNISFVFTKNINGYAIVNINNGWAMFASLSTGYGLVHPVPIQNSSFFLSTNPVNQHNVIQALSYIMSQADAIIPKNESIYTNSNPVNSRTLNLQTLVWATETGDISGALYSDKYANYHRTKIPLYVNIISNTNDLFGVLSNSPSIYNPAYSSVLDLLLADLNRAPNSISYAFAKTMGILAGTNTGFMNSNQLYTQLFGLLSLVRGAREGSITSIDTDRDRAFLVTTTSSKFFLTSTGKVYNINGTLIDILDNTQGGTIGGVWVSNSTTFSASFDQGTVAVGLLAPFTTIASFVGQMFGVSGLVEPINNLANNVVSGGLDVLNNLVSGTFVSINGSANTNANANVDTSFFYD